VSIIYRRVWRSLSGPDVITRICSAQYYCQTPPSLSPQGFRTYYWHAADAGPGRTGESHTKGHIECARDCGASGCSGGACVRPGQREERRDSLNTLSQHHTLDGALGFGFIGRLISSPELPRGSSATAPSILILYEVRGTSRKIIYGPWEGSAGPGERANERRTMSTVPVNVWTAQLSSPLLPCVPLLVQSCKALLSLLCSLPKTKP
jgi:hypothetical protein